MNPYQVMGIIACCTAIFAGVVSLLAKQGVPLVMAFFGVYLLAVWVMIGMQRRARQCYERDEAALRRYDRERILRRVRINDPTEAGEQNAARKQLHA